MEKLNVKVNVNFTAAMSWWHHTLTTFVLAWYANSFTKSPPNKVLHKICLTALCWYGSTWTPSWHCACSLSPELDIHVSMWLRSEALIVQLLLHNPGYRSEYKEKICHWPTDWTLFYDLGMKRMLESRLWSSMAQWTGGGKCFRKDKIVVL